MSISKQEAEELAEKFASVVLRRTVLRKNIRVEKSGDNWKVEIETTPTIIGEPKERIRFDIEKDGRIGAWKTTSI